MRSLLVGVFNDDFLHLPAGVKFYRDFCLLAGNIFNIVSIVIGIIFSGFSSDGDFAENITITLELRFVIGGTFFAVQCICNRDRCFSGFTDGQRDKGIRMTSVPVFFVFICIVTNDLFGVVKDMFPVLCRSTE